MVHSRSVSWRDCLYNEGIREKDPKWYERHSLWLWLSILLVVSGVAFFGVAAFK